MDNRLDIDSLAMDNVFSEAFIEYLLPTCVCLVVGVEGPND